MSHRCSDMLSSDSFSLCIPYHYRNMLRHLLLTISVLLSGLLYMRCVNEDIYLRSLRPDNRISSMVLRNLGDYVLSPSVMVYTIQTNQPHRGGVPASTLMASSPSELRYYHEFARDEMFYGQTIVFEHYFNCSKSPYKQIIRVKCMIKKGWLYKHDYRAYVMTMMGFIDNRYCKPTAVHVKENISSLYGGAPIIKTKLKTTRCSPGQR